MNQDTIFVYVVAVFAFGFALFNAACGIWHFRRTGQTVGTVVSVVTVNPLAAKARNSKWAQITYVVDGIHRTSKNRVQVPMTAQIGSQVQVRYNKEQPDLLYSFSLQRVLVALVITVICVVWVGFG